MAAPLFSKICMYRYWALGVAMFELLDGGSVVGGAVLARGERGERCAV